MKMLAEVIERLWRSIMCKEKPEKLSDMKEPSYEQIYLAYSRCFVWKNGAYHVGNHRLVDGFNPERVIAVFALSENIGNLCRGGNMSVSWYNNGTIYVCRSGEVLNRDVPSGKIIVTIRNFARELEREYQRHLKEVLKEQGCD